MTKKDKVREYLDSLKDKDQFNIRSVAALLKVEAKDVSNALKEYTADGRIQGEVKPGDRGMTYTAIGNVKAAVALKTLFPKPKANVTGTSVISAPQKARAKRRSPFVMAIDTEIKSLEDRICLLRKTRKEFE